MKISCVQMDMAFCDPEACFTKAEKLISEAVKENPDVIVLPETWNTGFFPRSELERLADDDGKRVKQLMGGLAKKFGVNIVAGSVTNKKNGGVYNTAFVFDRKGNEVAEYDKAHLFTPMGEDKYYQKGDKLAFFELDGQKCGIIICYDIRFPEWVRSYTVKGLDFLFVVSQWPKVRVPHLNALTKARAIENQMFVICCNSCGTAGKTVYGGSSTVTDPWGEVIAQAGDSEETITAECDPSILKNIRETINVFRDRRPEIYDIK